MPLFFIFCAQNKTVKISSFPFVHTIYYFGIANAFVAESLPFFKHWLTTCLPWGIRRMFRYSPSSSTAMPYVRSGRCNLTDTPFFNYFMAYNPFNTLYLKKGVLSTLYTKISYYTKILKQKGFYVVIIIVDKL